MRTTAEARASTVGLMILLAGLPACSDAVGPGGTPGPEAAKHYNLEVNLQVRLRDLEASWIEACDGRSVLTGEARDGEFQYRVQVTHIEYGHGRNGVFAPISTESRDYGSVAGKAYSLKPAEGLSLDREYSTSYVVPLVNDELDGSQFKPDEVQVRIEASEWDGLRRDSDLDRTVGWVLFDIVEGSSDPGGTVWAGDPRDCGLGLNYDIVWNAKRVEVGA